MTKYNTGNPVGSSDPRDLHDTASVADRLVHGESKEYTDRLGKSRKSWAGFEKDFADFLASSGYEFVGEYAPGVEVTAYHQIIRESGEFWRAAASTTLPYTTTGAGMPEGGAFVSVGDANLSQRLASTAPSEGASLVSMEDGPTVEEAVNNRVIRVSSRAEMKTYDLPVGYQFQLAEAGLSGSFVVKTGTPPNDPYEWNVVPLNNGNYAERIENTTPEESVKFPKTSGLLALNRTQAGVTPTDKKPVIVLGDSVSHGAFAGDLYYFGWTRLLARMLNAETGSRNYGFEPLVSLAGDNPNIHEVVFSGTWNSPTDGNRGLSGRLYRSEVIGNKITVSVPAFQNKLAVWYVGQVGGGTFTVSVDGSVVATVDTGASSSDFDFVTIDLPPRVTPAVTTYVIEHTAGSYVEIHGPSYYKDTSRPVLENFSNSGRALGDVTDETIDYVCANASALILALGLNDTDANISDMRGRVDKLISSCATNNTKLFIVDFMWTRSRTELTRLELQRLFRSVPGSSYIPLPDFIKADASIPDSSYLTSTIGIWSDIAHPNRRAHIWIAETVAKEMGLCNNSFFAAMREADYALPLSLYNVIRNFDLTDSDSISTIRINGDTATLYFSIKDGFSNPFPTGRQQIVSGWGRLSQIISGVNQKIAPAVINPSSGAVESTIEINPDGTMYIDVNSSTTQDQTFTVDYKIQYLDQTG